MSVSEEGFIAQRSATRIMRSRLRPSSLGLRLRRRSGKNMRYAAAHLVRNSDTGFAGARCCCSGDGAGFVVLRRAAATMSSTSLSSSPDDCNLPLPVWRPVASCVEPAAQRVLRPPLAAGVREETGLASSLQACAERTCQMQHGKGS